MHACPKRRSKRRLAGGGKGDKVGMGGGSSAEKIRWEGVSSQRGRGGKDRMGGGDKSRHGEGGGSERKAEVWQGREQGSWGSRQATAREGEAGA